MSVLNPTDRTLYIEALTPPPGFELDHAIGTTFSLDLATLLGIPLSFALNDWRADPSKLLRDPLAILEALRRYASRITLFCQAGQIAIPHAKKSNQLFAYLESLVFEVVRDMGVFHPKIWLARYKGPDGEVLYRFLCLSRNLSTDRAWDTALKLEGRLVDRQRAYAKNHPLGQFIARLPEMAQRELDPDRKNKILELAKEVVRVDFECPDSFEEVVGFWPIGIPETKKFPIDVTADRVLIISPFVSDNLLVQVATGKNNAIVSRAEELDQLESDTFARFSSKFVLADELIAVESDQAPAADIEEAPSARGLHAKLFVVDSGWNSNLWTGSANATNAGFEHNVEFLVQLRCKKSKGGIGVILGEDGRDPGLSTLLKPYTQPENPTRPSAQLRANERRLAAFSNALAIAKMRLKVVTHDNAFSLVLAPTTKVVADMAGIKGVCWPTSLPEGNQDHDVQTLVRDGRVSFTVTAARLTGFVAFRLEIGEGDAHAKTAFVLNLPLDDVPEDRLKSVLRFIIENRAGFLRYLMLLLASQETDLGNVVAVFDEKEGAQLGLAGHGDDRLPLLEELLRTLARAPSKLDAVSRLVEDLRRTEDGLALLPIGFLAVWDAIWAERKRIQ